MRKLKTNFDMAKFIFIASVFLSLISCTKNGCTPHATCNDGTLEFGCKKDVCKQTGIQFYHECKRKGKILMGC